MKNKHTILLDLDGVLNSYSGNYDEDIIPPIREGAFDFLTKLYQKYRLVLFSTRKVEHVVKWTEENGVKSFFSEITNQKQSAFLMIDDRSLCFRGDYAKTLEDINNFKVWWKSA